MRIPSIAVPEVQQSFREVLAKLDVWTGGQNVDFSGRRIMRAGDAVDPQDYVTLRQTRELITKDLASISPALTSIKAGLFGTHSQRLATAPSPLGIFYWETNRTALYQAQNVSGTAAWVFIINQPFYGTLSPDQKPSDLGVNDNGFYFYSTDFDRTYVWAASAWVDAPNQPKRGTIAHFPVTLHADFAPGNGWALCDGTAGVTRSTPSGGTTTVTVPDLTTSSRFLRSVSGATGGTGGSATTHTHSVDPPSTATSGPVSSITDVDNGGGQEVQSGTGVTVAAHTHDHNMDHVHAVDIGSFTSGAPSGSGGDDALPPYYNARPYMRL